MSDTPRTTDRVVFIDGNPWVNAPFARGLESELNAAKDRIKRLKEAGDAMEWWCCNNEAVFLWRNTKEAIRE